MINKRVFEALDCTLRNLSGTNQPMNGICMLLCGNFKQIFPIIPHKVLEVTLCEEVIPVE